MARYAVAIAALGWLLVGCEAAPLRPEAVGTIAVAPGENAALNRVYWVRQNPCESMLINVNSVSLTAGNLEGLELSVIRGHSAQPWQCPALTVPAALIVVRQTRPFPTAELRNISFAVSYETREGPQVSRHVASLQILPAGGAGQPVVR